MHPSPILSVTNTVNCTMLRPIHTKPFHDHHHSVDGRHLWFFLMETVTGRTGCIPIFPVNVTVTVTESLAVNRSLNNNGGKNGHGLKNVTCKQTPILTRLLSRHSVLVIVEVFSPKQERKPGVIFLLLFCHVFKVRSISSHKIGQFIDYIFELRL